MTSTVERDTGMGHVRGIVRLGVETYLGLRYAQPGRRFERALPPLAWSGTYDATTHRAMAAQIETSNELFGLTPKGGYSEDCLFLNLHVPAGPSSLPRPVLFFVHGGSHVSGAANLYDGTALALGADALVVCINYRVGVFGAVDRSRFGAPGEGTGELWLDDQIAALRWVHRNIADFGGNPDSVTVIGESAGAVGVIGLCAAPATKGLVHRAVACSGGNLVGDPLPDVVGAAAKARRASRAQAIEFLLNAPVKELLDLQKRTRGMTPGLCAGTELLPGRIEDLIRSRGADAVPMIAGYATHEGDTLDYVLKAGTGLPRPLLDLVQHLLARSMATLPANGAAFVPAYLRRIRRATGSRRFGGVFNDVVWTDVFRRASMDYAEAATAAGSRGYLYVIDVPTRIGKKLLRSSHCVDLALTFNVWDDPEHTVPAFAEHPGAPALGRKWVRMLGHFARTGEPGDGLDGDWPVYEPRTRASLRIEGTGCRLEFNVDPVFRDQVWVPRPA